MGGLTEQQKLDIVSRVKAKVAESKLDEKRLCVLHAALLIPILAEYGIDAVLQAGSASYLFKSPEHDDGIGPTHYSYVFESSPETIMQVMSGMLPEMHCWVAIPETSEIVDTTTEHLVALKDIAIPSEPWTAALPPPFLWARIDQLPDGWHYGASAIAIRIALSFINAALPEEFSSIKRCYQSRI